MLKRIYKFIIVATVLGSSILHAQPSPDALANPREAAPANFTGVWVSVVS